MNRLPVIDADGHIVEPFDIWQEMPSEFRDRHWRREVTADGREILYHEGRPLDIEWSTGTLSTPGAVQSGGRLDIDIENEVHPGVRDPQARLELMDQQGIGASVIFPSLMLGIGDVQDVPMQRAYATVYNNWIADFCRADPMRLKWSAVIAPEDRDAAFREAERAISMGASALMVHPIFDWAQTSVASPELDTLHGLLEEAGIPLVVHAINAHNRALGIANHLTNRVQWQMGYSFQCQLATLHTLDSDVFQRHPNLRVAFFEGDMGWLPHWFDRLDETYRKMFLVSDTRTESVRETFRRNCVISGDMNDPQLKEAVDYIGSDVVLFASDWPHHDGTWPDPLVAIRDHPGLTDDQKRDILIHAPARLFDIDVDALAAHLGDDWSTSADVAGIPPLLPDGRGKAILPVPGENSR